MPQILVKLEAYEGPFDLLVRLIEKHKLNLYDIPIAELTEQYILEFANYPDDMEFISEFIVMAATLLEIKSKMLLPKPNKDTQESDPRESLVEKLLEYKRFKRVAELLRGHEENGRKRFFRQPEHKLLQLLRAKKRTSSRELLRTINLEILNKIYLDVCSRRESRIDHIRAGFNAISKDSFTIEEKIEYIRKLLAELGRLGFFSVFYACRDKPEKVTTFLAMLELIKGKHIRALQPDTFEDISLTRLEDVL
jgi:segregation and condensation protein A